jgi:hypothetical protein
VRSWHWRCSDTGAHHCVCSFLDMLESYFQQPEEELAEDVRAELRYDVRLAPLALRKLMRIARIMRRASASMRVHAFNCCGCSVFKSVPRHRTRSCRAIIVIA